MAARTRRRLTKAAQTAAAAFDAVFLHPRFTPEATAGAVTRMREACERIGRDPPSLRVIQPIVTTARSPAPT